MPSAASEWPGRCGTARCGSTTSVRIFPRPNGADSSGPGPAASVLETTAEYLGIGIANLVNLLNPDRVVLAGWVAEVIGPQILPAVRASARRHALPYLYGQLQIQLGELGTDAVALGAATLPVVEILATGELPPSR